MKRNPDRLAALGPKVGRVLPRSHGLVVDHIALAVCDTQAGATFVKQKTGVEPQVHAPKAGQWHQSASLFIGDDSLLEIIGPNPDHRGLHPLKADHARAEGSLGFCSGTWRRTISMDSAKRPRRPAHRLPAKCPSDRSIAIPPTFTRGP